MKDSTELPGWRDATVGPCREKDCPDKPKSQKKFCLFSGKGKKKRSLKCSPSESGAKAQEKNVNYFKHQGHSSRRAADEAPAAKDPLAQSIAGSLQKLDVAAPAKVVADYLAKYRENPQLETAEGAKAFATFTKAVAALSLLPKWYEGLMALLKKG